MVALDGAADQSKRHDIQLQPPCVGRNRFSNSQHGSAASPPIMPATKLGSDTLKTVFHNSPAIQLAASIATMVSSRRCQIGNIGRIASFLFFAVLNYLRSRGCFQAPQRRMMLAALGALRPTLQARQLPVPTPCAARWPRRFFFGHMDHAVSLEPVEGAGRNLNRAGKLTNANASQGAGRCQLLSVENRWARPATMMSPRSKMCQIATLVSKAKFQCIIRDENRSSR